MRLHDLVVTSTRVATTTRGSGRSASLADALRARRADEIEPGSRSSPAPCGNDGSSGPCCGGGCATVTSHDPSLTLREVDDTFARLTSVAGREPGASGSVSWAHSSNARLTTSRRFSGG
jgi:hypothetical protein